MFGVAAEVTVRSFFRIFVVNLGIVAILSAVRALTVHANSAPHYWYSLLPLFSSDYVPVTILDRFLSREKFVDYSPIHYRTALLLEKPFLTATGAPSAEVPLKPVARVHPSEHKIEFVFFTLLNTACRYSLGNYSFGFLCNSDMQL
jgi:hypothetical protein